MVQTLRRCSSCGLPKSLVEKVEWLPGGTVALKRLKAVRLAVIDKSLYDRLHAGLSQQASQGDILIFGSQKKATRYVAGKAMKGVKARIVRYGMVMKRVLETMERYSLLLGMGRIEVERIKIEAGGSLLLKMPFNAHLLSAGITGVLEQVEGRAYAYSLSQTSEESFKLVIDACEDDDYQEEDFEGMGLLYPEATGGDGLERCRQCGAPSSLGSYNWDEIYGVIEDTNRGKRLAFMPRYMLDAAKKSAAYDGKKVAGILEDAAYSSAMEELENGEYYAGIEELVHEFAVKGWGQATALCVDGGTWRLTMANPLDVSLIAGWLRAFYFSRVNREPRSSVTEGDFRAEILLE